MYKPHIDWMRFANQHQILAMLNAKAETDTGVDEDSDVDWKERFITNLEGGLYRLAERGELDC